MKNNTNKQSENMSLINVPAIIKKIEDSPGWEKNEEKKRKRHSRISFIKQGNMPKQEERFFIIKTY